jgi:hypothetical protein
MGILSWSGRGLIVLPLLIGPGFLMIALESKGPEVALLAFSAGWVLSGAICLWLGRWWNRDEPRHKFGRLRMETWGYILLGFGLLLSVPRVIALLMPHAPPPRRRVP